MKFKLLDETTPINDLPPDAFDDAGDFKFWLVTNALKEQELNISKTWVLFEEDELIGFFTTRLGTYGKDAKGVFLLAKLAVLKKYQKQGYGKQLLLKCIGQAQELLKITAFDGILAYSKKEALDFYTQFGFIEIFGNQLLLKSDQFEVASKKIKLNHVKKTS